MDIEDTAFLDGGWLNDWSMEVCFSNPALSVIVPKDHRMYNCNDFIEIETYIYSEQTNNWEVRVKDVDGNYLDVDYSPSGLHANSRFVRLLDKSQLDLGKNQLILELLDGDTDQLLAFAAMELLLEDDIGRPVVDYPVNNSDILIADFDHVAWSTNFGGNFIAQIATDPAFEDIVWSFEGSNRNEISVDDTFEKGEYYFRVILVNDDCQSISPTIKYTLRMSVSTENQIVSDVNVYPNPVTDQLYISNTGSLDQIELFDLNGQRIHYQRISQSQENIVIDVADWSAGIYLIIIGNEESQIRKRVVKL